MNAGSIEGKFGENVKKTAEIFLENKYIILLDQMLII